MFWRTYTVLLCLVCIHFQCPIHAKRFQEISHAGTRLGWVCSEGWTRQESICYSVYNHETSWSAAHQMCLLQGGTLVMIEGYVKNQFLGNFVAEYLSDIQENGTTLFWTGFHGSYDNYEWGDDSLASAYEGFWSWEDHPSNEHTDNKCAGVDWSTTYQNKWFLGDCSQAFYYVCQQPACLEKDFRCTDGGCIPNSQHCNRQPDCEDGSDELNCPDNCDVKIEGTSGIIESPNYPENYPMYSHCVYQIHGPVGTRIWIQMEETDLEKKYDFVTVYKHGIIGDDKHKRRYTGIHNNYKDIDMPNHRAAIVFTSDGTVSKKGFRLTWEARDHACKTSSKLTAEWTPQDLYSPGFQTNDNYPEESTCVWMIKTSTDQCDSQDDPENIDGDESLVSTCQNTDVDVCDGWNDIVTLQFIAFETEDSSDFVTVFNSRGHTHKVLDMFSGSSLPRPLITTARFMRVELTSDSDNTFKGFHATYKKGCADIIMNQSCGIITSPGYDIAKYKNKVECSWKMVHPDGSALTVLFDDFNLRLTDHICVFDGMDKNDEVLLTEYNGGLKGNIAPPPLRSEEGNLYMVFYSDRKKRNEGFYARFSQDCPTFDLSEGVILSTDSRQFGTEVDFSCGDGYLFETPENYTRVTCDFCGVWNFGSFDGPPRCKPVSCGQPPLLDNCIIEGITSRTFGGAVTYNCQTGYEIQGNAEMGCQADASWGPSHPTCHLISCEEPTASVNGLISNLQELRDSGFPYNSVIQYGCLTGFQPSGITTATCRLDGQWTNDPPICERALCVQIYMDDTTSILLPSGPYRVGDSVRLDCKPGYTLPPSEVITTTQCVRSDLWNPDKLTSCIDKDECRHEMDNCDDNTQTCHNLIGSYECRCTPGYEVSPDSQSECQDIDECTNQLLNNCNQQCTNTDGDYICSCNTGYVLFQEDGTNGFFLPPGESGHNSLDSYIFNRTCVPMLCYASADLDPCEIIYPMDAVQRDDGIYIRYAAAISIIPQMGFIVDGASILVCRDGGLLNGDMPQCIAATCTAPEDIVDGTWVSSDPGNYGYRSTVEYSCDEGYFLTGSHIRVCEKFSESYYLWSGFLPVCTVECGSLTSPVDGFVQYDDTTEGNTAVYSCDIGYQLFGSEQRVCQLDGTWSGDIPHCQLKSCDNPGTPEGGQQHVSDLSFFLGSTVYCTCNVQGFAPVPSEPIECIMDDFVPARRRRRNTNRQPIYPAETRKRRQSDEPYWSADIPICVDTEPPVLSCPPIKVILTNETEVIVTYDPVDATDNDEIESITYSQPNELTVRTLTYVKVTATATDTTGNTASCDFYIDVQATDCPTWSLGVPDEQLSCSDLAVTDTVAGYSCSVTCPEGSDFIQPLPEPGYFTCRVGTGWEPHNIVPLCVMQENPQCQLSLEGTFNSQTGVTERYCYDLYVEFLEAFFLEQGETQFLFLCDRNTLENIEFLFRAKMSVLSPTVLTVELVIGLNVVGENIKIDNIEICQDNLSTHIISEMTSLSVEVNNDTCPNFVLSSEGFQERQESNDAACTCPSGYSFRNDHCLKCTKGTHEIEDSCVVCSIGTYQDEDGQQECKLCPENHSTHRTTTQSASDCIALCPPGSYSSTGMMPCDVCLEDTITAIYGSTECQSCPEDTHSNPGYTQCIESCEVGSFSSSGLEPCTACHVNFFQETRRATSCVECADIEFTQDEGASSSSDCIDACFSSPCLNGATCSAYSHTWHCECADNYFGVNCENAYSCDNYTPCLNGGVCEQTENSYRCSCPSNFFGDYCENERTPCTTNPCENGGSCYLTADGFQCDCPPDFTSELCEQTVNDCASLPCNAGLCIDIGYQSVQCFCFFGWGGDFCNVNLRGCDFNFCLNGGSCVEEGVLASCQCMAGFTGSLCQVNIDDCLGENCDNGGTCIDGIDSFQCECTYGWTGALCDEIDDDPCDPNLCVHGVCVQTANPSLCHCPGFTCQCDPGFDGPLCAFEFDECSSNPCANGGECTDLTNDFDCSCPDGFIGATCSEVFDYCSSTEEEPCKNGGTCSNVIGGNFCSCTSGWTSSDCTVSIDDCIGDPCHNGATCVDGHNDFTCNCVTGYEGPNCSNDIDECQPSLSTCKNGGVCINSMGSYKCHCVPGYSGEHCQTNINDCTSNPCMNGAVCLDGLDEFTCSCTPFYEGIQCEKEKSEDFDVYLCSTNSAMIGTGVLDFGKLAFTLMFWIRYATLNGEGQPFQLLTSHDGSKFEVLLSLPSSPEFTVLQSTLWHHVAVTWATDTNIINWYIDGSNVYQSNLDVKPGDQTPPFVKVVLGGQYQSIDDSEAFHGEISQFNIDDTLWTANDISQLAGSCTVGSIGHVVRWLDFRAESAGCAYVVEPSLCGDSSECPPRVFYQGNACQFDEIDVTPPELVPGTCPDTIQVIDPDNHLVQVIYNEPQFVDNVNVTDITCTIPSSSVLAYGVYESSCVAYDEDGNHAVCTFMVYVLPHACEDPAAPVQGSKTCGVWQHGQFCNIACNEGYYFTAQPAPYYVCGREGVWDARSPDEVFTFPGCADAETPGIQVSGTLSYTVATCDSDGANQELVDAFKEKINYFNGVLNHEVCGAIVCDFSTLRVTCGTTNRRRKRSQIATIDFTFLSVTTDIGDQNIGDMLDEAVYNGTMDIDDNSADYESFEYEVVIKCSLGQVQYNGLCVYCPQGEFHDVTRDTCKKCSVGEYQDSQGQTECIPCSVGKTTRGKGATSQSMCLDKCHEGTFYKDGHCTSCPLGMYQDESGKFTCLACPTGTSTNRDGATSFSECIEVCLDAGQYLGISAICESCPRGTYSIEGETYCRQCPYQTTTSEPGSVSLDDCKQDPCEDYCLNGGDCTLDDSNVPQCACLNGKTGVKCDMITIPETKQKMEGYIIGIVIGVGGGVILIIVVTVLARKYSHPVSKRRQHKEEQRSETYALRPRFSDPVIVPRAGPVLVTSHHTAPFPLVSEDKFHYNYAYQDDREIDFSSSSDGACSFTTDNTGSSSFDWIRDDPGLLNMPSDEVEIANGVKVHYY